MRDAPAGYLLDSDDPITIRENTIWDPVTKSMQIKGGFYGPVHTNQAYTYNWISMEDEILSRGSPANTLDESQHDRWEPYTGVLQVDRATKIFGVIVPGTVLVFNPGVDFQYAPRGYFWYLNWSPPGSEPGLGSLYDVTNQAFGSTFNAFHSAANSKDLAFAPGGVASAQQGPTTFSEGSDYTTSSQAFIDWNVPPSIKEPNGGQDYNVRFITHSPIHVFGNMTYAGAAPKLRYKHEHFMSNGAPLYQQSHGHNNIIGADLAANMISNNPGPGYDGANPGT